MIVKKVYNWLQRLKLTKSQLPIQVHCLLCRTCTYWNQPICKLCFEHCVSPHSFCSICGIPMAHSATGLCGQCISQPPPFDLCISAYLYQFPVNRVVQRIKYNGRLELINPITKHLTDILQDYYLDASWPEIIIPVPLHNRRLRRRGYDQALLLAKEIHQQLTPVTHIPIDHRSLKRHRATRQQQGLDAKTRKKNLRQAFSIIKPVSYQHVALVDDVVTTGETVSEITRLLKKNNVERVDIWSLARTPRNSIPESGQ